MGAVRIKPDRRIKVTRCIHRFESGRRCMLPAHNGAHSIDPKDLPKDVELVLENHLLVRRKAAK